MAETGDEISMAVVSISSVLQYLNARFEEILRSYDHDGGMVHCNNRK